MLAIKFHEHKTCSRPNHTSIIIIIIIVIIIITIIITITITTTKTITTITQYNIPHLYDNQSCSGIY